jgi:type VI secretion system secreted protein VgrG
MNDVQFTCRSLEDGAPRLLAFSCDEELERPYEARVWVELAADVGPAHAALGQSASLRVGPSSYDGVVFEVELVQALAARAIHRITVGPALQALALGLHSRVFVGCSIPQIIQAVLAKNGIVDYELRLDGSYPARPHVCQYKESDLSFLHRWMEREGIYYYFAQRGARLIITDDRHRHDAHATVVHYRRQGMARGSDAGFVSWERAHRGVTRSVTVGDYDYLKPALRMSRSMDGVAVGFEEQVRFEDNAMDTPEVDRMAALRAQSLETMQVRFAGRGHVPGLHAGCFVILEDHPRYAFNHRYQLSRVRQVGTALDGDTEVLRHLGFEPTETNLGVDVEALADDVQYRPPRRTDWPRVAGVESAVVDGPADTDVAQLDDEGRYKVRMLFDEAGRDAGTASAWLRMQQAHAGAPEGLHFPLRKGTEVLVAFVHGDPDRPFILGAAPTPKTRSPVTSANHTQNVIETGGESRVVIDDRAGAQYIDLSTPPESTFLHLGAVAGLGSHNVVVATHGDGLESSGLARDVSVLGALSVDIAGNLVESYGAKQTTNVTASFTETIGGAETQVVSSGFAQTIHSGLTETITGGETRDVTGSATETFQGGRTQTIVGPTVETVDGTLKQQVGAWIGISTPSTYTLNAAGGITMTTPAAAAINATAGLRIIAPGGHLSVDSFLESVGVDNFAYFFVRLNMYLAKLTVCLFWGRYQLAHFCMYGLKVDAKVVDKKTYGKEHNGHVLKCRSAAMKLYKAGLTSIETKRKTVNKKREKFKDEKMTVKRALQILDKTTRPKSLRFVTNPNAYGVLLGTPPAAAPAANALWTNGLALALAPALSLLADGLFGGVKPALNAGLVSPSDSFPQGNWDGFQDTGDDLGNQFSNFWSASSSNTLLAAWKALVNW